MSKFELKPEDLRVDTYQESFGMGFGLSQKNAVRITHIPTGIFSSCSFERSEHANKTKAMEELLSILSKSDIPKLTGQRILTRFTEAQAELLSATTALQVYLGEINGL